MKPIQKQLVKTGGVMAVGLLFLLVAVFSKTGNRYVPSLGGSFFLLGAIRLARFWRIARDPERARRYNIAMTEERAAFLERQTSSWMFYFTLLGESVALVACMLLDMDTPVSILSIVVCAQCLLRILIFYILNKKY